MILLIGGLTDGSIGYLVWQLVDRQESFLLLDPRELGSGFDVSWEWRDDAFVGALRIDDRVIPLDTIRSAYVHNLQLPQPATSCGAATASTKRDIHWLLYTFVEDTPFLVVNRPSSWATNLSKPYQQQKIAAAGFKVPRTLITNDPDKARDFYELCRKRVIFKSISCRRSIVARLREQDLERLDAVRTVPTQFQEWLPGTDVRVHVTEQCHSLSVLRVGFSMR